jgi:hypothetical protein
MRRTIALSTVLWLAVARAPLQAVDLFADDFARPDGLLDADPADDWLTTLGTADIVNEEALLQTAGSEGWTWIDSVSFSGDVSFKFEIAFDPSDITPEVGRHGGVMFFATEKTDRYSPGNSGYTIDWIDRVANPNDHGYRFHKWINGVEQILIPDSFADDPDPGREWRITISGPLMALEVDGVLKTIATDEELREGHFGFWGWSNGQHIHIDNVQVQEPPAARIVATPDSGPAPLQVAFDGSGSTTPEGTIVAHAWDFGDGSTGNGAQMQHTYSAPGVHVVTLGVTDSRGITAHARHTVRTSFAPGDIAPWQSSDVGTPALPGGARFEDGCLNVFASGKEILATEDHFHFVHQSRAGDAVTLTTQVKEILHWEAAGPRAGVMLRDSLDADSAFALMALQPSATGIRALFLSRKAKGERVLTRTTPVTALVPPDARLRIERQGADLIGRWYAPETMEWREFSRATLTAPQASMLGGLAVTAADKLDAGLFANIIFCETGFGDSALPPEAPENLTATPGDGQVALSWTQPAGGTAPDGFTVFRDGFKVAELPASPTSHVDGGLGNGTNFCYTVYATAAGLSSEPSNQACATPTGNDNFHRGDANNDGKHNISDPVNTLNVLFLGDGIISCQDAADTNDDGKVNISDPVNSLNVLFLGVGTVPPPLPEGPCGPDPTPDAPEDLGCAGYTQC